MALSVMSARVIIKEGSDIEWPCICSVYVCVWDQVRDDDDGGGGAGLLSDQFKHTHTHTLGGWEYFHLKNSVTA